MKVFKKLKCLRCGILMRTTPEIRICSICHSANAKSLIIQTVCQNPIQYKKYGNMGIFEKNFKKEKL
jgi:hypothetical protein